jgi:hypothetical protein
MGDRVLAGTGDELADCLAHEAVALFTDANVAFSGEPSFLTETSAFGGAISFKGVGFGLSATDLTGGVGSGRENRDCSGAGIGEGDTAIGAGLDCGRGDFCGVV